MNYRLALMLTMFVLLTVTTVTLAFTLPDHGWVTYNNQGKPIDIALGWGILTHLWPIALLGTLISGMILFLIVAYTYQYAEEKDHEAELQTMQNQIDEAKKIANWEIKRVEKSYEAREAKLDKKESELDALRAQSEALQQTLKQELHRVKRVEKTAQIEVQRATRKKNNAMGAMARRRKKQMRLDAQKTAQA